MVTLISTHVSFAICHPFARECHLNVALLDTYYYHLHIYHASEDVASHFVPDYNAMHCTARERGSLRPQAIHWLGHRPAARRPAAVLVGCLELSQYLYEYSVVPAALWCNQLISSLSLSLSNSPRPRVPSLENFSVFHSALF
jgi:hypothetical protein